MLKILKPRVIDVVKANTTPQCCMPVDAPIYNKAWREQRYGARADKGLEWSHNHCQRPSTVQIGERFYCRPHAAQKALEMWCAGELQEVSSDAR